MERQESGAIGNISSINGISPAALVGAYNVAKAGVVSLSRTLAIELAAYGVRVYAIAPVPVYTEFNQSNMAQRSQSLGIPEEEMIERVRKMIPHGRWGEPFDMAAGVAGRDPVARIPCSNVNSRVVPSPATTRTDRGP